MITCHVISFGCSLILQSTCMKIRLFLTLIPRSHSCARNSAPVQEFCRSRTLLAVLTRLLSGFAVGSSFACVQMCSQLKWARCLKAQSWWRFAQLIGVFFQSSLAIQQATLCMGLTFKRGYNLAALRFLEGQKHVSSSVQNVHSWFHSKTERRNKIRFLKFVFLSYIVPLLQIFI